MASLGTKTLMWEVQANFQESGLMRLIPFREWENQAELGMHAAPLLVDRRHRFVLTWSHHQNMCARMAATGVAEALISEGAARGPGVLWCLLCSKQLVYLGPVRHSNCQFFVVSLELIADDNDRD